MTRLFLLVVLGVVAMYYFPDSRQILVEKSQPLWVPLVKWDVKEEMKQVGRDVVNHEIQTGRMLDRRSWLEWLEWRYPMEDLTKDAWGTTYELRVWSDSVGIMSYGPDRVKATEDDFYISQPRDRGARRRR